MFKGNTSIEILDLRCFTAIRTYMNDAFAANMTSLKKLYFPSLITEEPASGSAQAGNGHQYIGGDTALQKIVLPYTCRRTRGSAFNQNGLGATLIIGDAINGSQLVSMCEYQSLTGIGKLVLYATTPPYWHGFNSSRYDSTTPRGNTTIPNACKIYVPDTAVDTYKNSGNSLWGQFASRIYPISEFEGEL